MFSYKLKALIFLILIHTEYSEAVNNRACATLNITEPVEKNSNFLLPPFPESVSLKEWSKLDNFSIVTSIQVRVGCMLRLCLLENNSTWDYQKCRRFDSTFSHSQPINVTEATPVWNGEYNRITGFDCSCDIKGQDVPCPAPPRSFNSSQDCAILCVEPRCYSRNFQETLLKVDQSFNKKLNDSMTIFSSIIVRPNCTVMSQAIKDGKPYAVEYTSSGEQNDWIDRYQYNYEYFNCSCNDVPENTNQPTTSSPEMTKGNFSIYFAALIALCSILVLTVIGLICMRIYEHRKQMGELHYVVKHKVKRIIQRDQINIDFTKLLGSGAFGKVFLSTLKNTGEKVAVKQIRSTNVSSKYIGSLTREMELLALVGSHPNIVKLVGVCVVGQGSEILLLMEYCEHRSLDKFLRSNKAHFVNRNGALFNTIDKPIQPEMGSSTQTDYDIQNNLERLGYIQEKGIEINPNLLIKIAVDISMGMEHLSKFRILHMDLACRNILIDIQLTAKVGDLGLSKQLEKDSTYYHKPPFKQPLPILSLSPEVLTTFKFSPKSDIWGMGVLLWEIFSMGDTPYKEINRFFIKSKIENGYRLPKPGYCSDEMYDIMMQCWNKDPSLRPDFSQLTSLLRALQKL